jgi:hypothetical protein
MKWLADENIPHAGFGIWARTSWEWSRPPPARMIGACSPGRAERGILLTFDKDFAELFAMTPLPKPSGLVLLRLAMSPPGDVANFLVGKLMSRDDWGGCFSVIERDRIRMKGVFP